MPEQGPEAARPLGQPANGGDISIGVAAQDADGTIILTLRGEGPGGSMGDAQLRYAPSDPNYQVVSQHVGPIPRGVAIPVRPFQER